MKIEKQKVVRLEQIYFSKFNNSEGYSHRGLTLNLGSAYPFEMGETFNQTFSLSKNYDLVLDLNDLQDEYDQLDSEELGLYVSAKLSKINEGQTVKLPAKRILVDYLLIQRSCKIIGSPETTLDVTGSILVGSFITSDDEYESIDQENREVNVQISELEIHY